MKIELEPTRELVQLRADGMRGVVCRIWKGTTESGQQIEAYVASLGVDEGDESQIRGELANVRERANARSKRKQVR